MGLRGYLCKAMKPCSSHYEVKKNNSDKSLKELNTYQEPERIRGGMFDLIALILPFGSTWVVKNSSE